MRGELANATLLMDKAIEERSAAEAKLAESEAGHEESKGMYQQ